MTSKTRYVRDCGFLQ